MGTELKTAKAFTFCTAWPPGLELPLAAQVQRRNVAASVWPPARGEHPGSAGYQRSAPGSTPSSARPPVLCGTTGAAARAPTDAVRARVRLGITKSSQFPFPCKITESTRRGMSGMSKFSLKSSCRNTPQVPQTRCCSDVGLRTLRLLQPVTGNLPLVAWSFLIPALDFYFNFQKSPLQLFILMQRRLINVQF